MALSTLIVDDSADARTWLKHHLEEFGCEVVGEAANAAEGLRLFEALHPRLGPRHCDA
jgi:YesN/AraC family two-component response regulator